MITPSSVVANTPTFAGNTHSRLKKATLLFRYLAEINIIIGGWYMLWRITQSVNYDALWLSIPLLIAEIYSYIGGVIFTLGLWRPLVRQVKSLDQFTPPMPREDWPTVDAFATCYNEPVEILEQTIRAALALDYPVNKLKVYLLDDGNSPAMRAMVQKVSLEDLQSPVMQQEADRLDSIRSELVDRLHQLEQLSPDLQSAELLLPNSDSSQPVVANNPLLQRLQSLREFLLLLNPGSKSVTEYLAAEKQALEDAIHQKDLELSELVRCRYIARPKPEGKAHHAKAGNLNYAMFSGETSGEFIITLDADHVLMPHFLQRVLPYFYNYNVFKGRYESNKIAFVQTPQDFHNLPLGDPFGHSAHLFYGPIQQGKDGLDSAFYTGTDAILRREALVSMGLQNFAEIFSQDETRLEEFELIGGVASNTITEDMNTAMRLHAAGWKSVYHNELMALGLAPDDLNSTLNQRLRWAQGTLQVLQRENPLTKPGLTFWQRLQYFQTMYSYFAGFATLIFIAAPIIYFFFEVVPVKSFGPDFALHFLPAFILNRLTFIVACWGIPAREIWRSEQYAIGLFPMYIEAVLNVFAGKKLTFTVTPKQRQAGIYLHRVYPQLLIFALTILGMIWSLYRFLTGQLGDSAGTHLVNAAWAVYNLSLLWAIVRASVWQPRSANR
jgi:cellulose synthase (UDP-forming)